MKQKKKLLWAMGGCLLAAVLLLGVLWAGTSGFLKSDESVSPANGAALTLQMKEQGNDDENKAEPLGLVTNLTLAVDGGDGEVSGIVKNSFTLLPSTIIVYLELYSSLVYETDYTAMTLEGRAYDDDLNQGETLTVTCSTGGVQKYWMARIYYKFDSRDWAEKTTDAYLYDGDGFFKM